CGQGTHLLTF
nr:immunoglobulin light chain junction region [Macaca mulatta]MOV85919.1 immunoglobulin light chain junction region [Macaca mulatta]MOV86389.1 immunoglobulin light chain junction region [Macaca mulatta]